MNKNVNNVNSFNSLEQSLEKSVEEWNFTFNAISDIICIIDKDGKITHCNDAATKLCKKNKDEFIGHSCWEPLNCYSESLKNCPMVNIQKLHKREIITLHFNGKWFRSSIDPIIDKNNNIIGAVHIMSDITKYKRAQNALKESEELYRKITEYSNDMIWTLNNDGNFTFFNKRSEQKSGYKLEDMISKNIHNLVIEKDFDRTIDIYHAALSGIPQQFEVTIKNKYNKQLTLSVNTTPIYSKGQIIGTLSSGRDITDTIIHTNEVNKLNEKLKASNKELRDFAYTTSHDLQEPLRSISGFIKIFENRYKGKLDSDADEFINYIVEGTTRMQQMIHDLLILSKVGTKDKEFMPINISDVIIDVQKNLHSMIEINNAIIIIEDIPTINADYTELVQLFQNLIVNAIKFRSEKNPIIYISVKQRKPSNQLIGESPNEESNEEYIFSVRDNGIGIDKKDFDKLFRVFSRLHSKEKYPGTGIGLAICRKIVERHKGKIWVTSKLGEGSTFYFTIPK